jgi:hypothetical protein|uniref:Prolamin-like domain-containing protein n=1 Tax=Fagus sylvatica TaxID=28930 RepID=A0A2N9G1B2_FAGSY
MEDTICAILVLLICSTTSFTLSQAQFLDIGNILKCFSGNVDISCMPQITQSASDGQISVSPGCCKAILDFDEDCASSAFAPIPFFYPLLKSHCIKKTKPTPACQCSSSLTPSPTSLKNPPPSQKSPPSIPETTTLPIHIPPPRPQEPLPFDLKPVPLPNVVVGDHVGNGCWQGSGSNKLCWTSKGHNVCCNLSRNKGQNCSGGREYDNYVEFCCMYFKDGSKKCYLVTPYYSY